jgi:predicted metal-binding membrane protein
VTAAAAPPGRRVQRPSFGLLGGCLLVLAAAAWVQVVRGAASMDMTAPGAALSLTEAAAFTAAWGVMMTAMMLPSAMPMLLLYRTVRGRLHAQGERSIPAWLFTSVYLLLWTAIGLPVYAGYVAEAAARERLGLEGWAPYGAALVLVLAGVYQFSRLKTACLRGCESPLSFLMRRWKAGRWNTTRLAIHHTAYCIGCCWGLMAVLVVAGAMGLTWVALISLAVLAEKLLGTRRLVAPAIGVLLILTGLAVIAEPTLAARLSGHTGAEMRMPMAAPR